MKKFLVIATVAVFVLTLAATTYAVDFKASGLIRIRPISTMNTNGAHLATSASYDHTRSFVDERFRLQMKLVANEDLYGVIYIEGDSTAWGEAAGGRNAIGSWGSDRVGVEAKQFYIDFNVPGIKDVAPTNVRAGMQWLAIRSHVFVGVDAPGIRVRTDAGPVRIYLNWFKAAEGANIWQSHDETDLYAARVVLNLPDFPVKPGMFVAYWNGNDYPLGANAQTQRADFYWVGVNADGKVGPASFKADFVYVSGDVDRTSAGLQDREYGGWVFYADANLPIAMMTVGGTFMYATGDDVTDATAATGDLEHDGYVVPPATEGNPVLSQVFWAGPVHDSIFIARSGNTAGQARTSGTQMMQRYWGGLWTIKGYASFKPLDWLKVTGYAMYIGDTTSDGDTVGTAINAAGQPEDEDYIGIEVGAIADIKIYKELTFNMGLGYLFAGDAMDSWTGVGTVNDSPDDPWAILTQLIYKF
jgi:hypothetical protein